MILWVRGSRVGNQNRSKFDQNLKSKMECLLASIFNGFRWVLGVNLGRKIDPRSIKKDPKGHQKNDREKRASWKRLGSVLGFQNPSDSAGGGRGGGDAGATP